MKRLGEKMRAAHTVDDWSGVSFEERSKVLWDLLELVDALPIHGEAALPSQVPSLPEKFIAVHDALRAMEVPHAIGGAFALAYYAEPRSTADIDVNVFAPADRWPEIGDALKRLGVDVSGDTASLEREGEIQPRWDRNPVHLFFSRDEMHTAMAAAVRHVPFGEVTLPIVAAEHLLVRKTMLDRTKDWADIERIVETAEDLDLAEAEEWLGRLAGESDPRLERLQQLARSRAKARQATPPPARR